MADAIADLENLLKDIPTGAWVAISERQHIVVAYGPDAQKVLSDAHEKGEGHPLIVRVPEHAAAMFL
jgi:hypothetical protein